MEKISKFSTVTGTVVGVNNYGCYVRDDVTDTVVFYYGNGNKGDRVLLSVFKVDKERERVTCRLDSVIEYAAFDYAA